ncbi:MAG: DUF4230 domain-containing protein [Kiritimatiellia bacterium]
MSRTIFRIVFLAIAILVLAGCSIEEVITEITAVKEIGELAVYKVQDADLLTAKDKNVEVKYIAYTEVLICVDFANVKITTSDSKPHVYEVAFPEFTVKQPRVIHDPKYSRVWKVSASGGKSTTRVDNALKIQAERAIAKKAQSPEYMKPAKEQAKSIVEAMIRAADKEASFVWNP